MSQPTPVGRNSGQMVTKRMLTDSLMSGDILHCVVNNLQYSGRVTRIESEDGSGHNFNVTIAYPSKPYTVFVRTID